MNAQGVYLIFQIFKGSFIGEGRLLQSTQYQEKNTSFHLIFQLQKYHSLSLEYNKNNVSFKELNLLFKFR